MGGFGIGREGTTTVFDGAAYALALFRLRSGISSSLPHKVEFLVNALPQLVANIGGGFWLNVEGDGSVRKVEGPRYVCRLQFPMNRSDVCKELNERPRNWCQKV